MSVHSRLRHATRRRPMHCDILNVAPATRRRRWRSRLLIAASLQRSRDATPPRPPTPRQHSDDYRDRHPITHEGRQEKPRPCSSAPAAAGSRRCSAPRFSPLPRTGSATPPAASHRPSRRRRQRARRQRHAEGNAVDHRAGRRAQQRHRHPALPSRREPRDLAAELSADGGRCRSLRTVARRSWPEL